MANPPVDVATYLSGQSIGLTIGTNLFNSPEVVGAGVPQNAAFIWGASGGRPDRNVDTRIEHRFAVVHIRVRNTSQQAADTIARNIMTKLQVADISGYLDIRSLQSEPVASFESQGGVNRISLSYEAVYESNLIA